MTRMGAAAVLIASVLEGGDAGTGGAVEWILDCVGRVLGNETGEDISFRRDGIVWKTKVSCSILNGGSSFYDMQAGLG